MSEQIDDIVKISPDVHEVIFENDQIRALKVIVKPSDMVPMHRNPENINYILRAGTLPNPRAGARRFLRALAVCRQ
jgi:hypothetical protein